MLLKMFKYQMKSMGKIFWPLLIATVCVMISIFVMIRIQVEAIDIDSQYGGIALSILMGMIMMGILALYAIIIVSAVSLTGRVYSEFETDNAYLTFTLPIKIKDQVFVRFLAMSIYFCIMAVVLIASFILFGGIITLDWYEKYFDILKEIFTNVHGTFIWLELTVLMFITVIGVASRLMFAVVLGGAIMKRHKIVGAILVIFIINFIDGLITQGLYYFGILSMIGGVEGFNSIDAEWRIHLFLSLGILLQIIPAWGYYFITRKKLEKAINLQ